MTTVSSWMMIDAVMYGMMPSANTDSLSSAPPENRFNTVEVVVAATGLVQARVDRAVRDPRRRHGRAESVHGDHGQREEDLLAEIRRLQRRDECGEQWSSWRHRDGVGPGDGRRGGGPAGPSDGRGCRCRSFAALLMSTWWWAPLCPGASPTWVDGRRWPTLTHASPGPGPFARARF